MRTEGPSEQKKKMRFCTAFNILSGFAEKIRRVSALEVFWFNRPTQDEGNITMKRTAPQKTAVIFFVAFMAMTVPMLGASASPAIDPAVDAFIASGRGTMRAIVHFRDLQAIDPSDYEGHSGQISAALRANAAESQRGFRTLMGNIKDSRAVGAAGNILELWAANAVIGTFDPAALSAVAALDEVESVEVEGRMSIPPDREGQALTPRGGAEWSLTIVNADKVWNHLGVNGSGVTLGIIDTGIFADHPDLAGKVLKFKDFTKDNAGQSVKPYDDQGHGTHCAGTICGGAASGTAIGMAPGARLIVGKSFDSSGSGGDGPILGAMQWMLDPDGDPATDDAPALCSNSWGSSEQTSTTYWKIIEAWRAAGIFPLFAAGNSGPSPRTVGTPGGYPHAFAIGATTNSDGIAGFSSRGPIKWDGNELIKPNVSAPGNDIRSAGHRGGYTVKSGTSMATPNVAGAIALMLSAEPGLSIEDIWKTLEDTAVDLGAAGRDNTFGTGRIDVFEAVQRVLLGGKVTGRVLAAGSGAPIAAKVTVGGTAIVVPCGADGSYTLMLPEGKYDILFSHFGFITFTHEVVVVKKQTVTLDAALGEAPRRTLAVTVADQTGNPLAARIRLTGTPVEPCETAADGTARIDVPMGTYDVMASSLGFSTRVVNGVSVADNGGTVKVVLDRLPPILVVDQAKGTEPGSTVKATLEALGKSHSYVSLSTGAVNAGDLAQYPVVIWITGTSYSGLVDGDQQAALTSFVASGGNLMICGSDIGYCLKAAPFMKETLGAAYEADNARVAAVSGKGPLDGLALDITGDTTGLKQSYPDVINPTGDGAQAAVYSNGMGAGTFVETEGHGRVIYLGFCLTGVKGLETRKALFEKALGWLAPDVARAVRAFVSCAVPEMARPCLERAFSLVVSTTDGNGRFKATFESLSTEERERAASLHELVLEHGLGERD